MKMGTYNSDRNYGYGKQMAYAGKNALRDAYQGRYATVAAHGERWGQFSQWAKEQGIRDATLITRDTVVEYGQELSDRVSGGEMSTSYAQNLLSTVNVTLSAMRGDNAIKVSPSAMVGERTGVRDSAPSAMDRSTVSAAAADLRDRGLERAATVLEAARDLGLRAKEAVMMDYRAAVKEAERRGVVDVREGTKGGRGREVERLVPVSERAMETLRAGAALQQETGGRNLIEPGGSWKSVNDSLRSEPVRAVMAEHGLAGYHDARAAYASERYQQITGHQAPAVAGIREVGKEADREARQVIAQELGHGRTDVVAAYVGSAR